MKPIINYWKSSLQKAQIQKIRRVTTANDCVERKIRMAEIQLKAAFEKESKLSTRATKAYLEKNAENEKLKKAIEILKEKNVNIVF